MLWFSFQFSDYGANIVLQQSTYAFSMVDLFETCHSVKDAPPKCK